MAGHGCPAGCQGHRGQQARERCDTNMTITYAARTLTRTSSLWWVTDSHYAKAPFLNGSSY